MLPELRSLLYDHATAMSQLVFNVTRNHELIDHIPGVLLFGTPLDKHGGAKLELHSTYLCSQYPRVAVSLELEPKIVPNVLSDTFNDESWGYSEEDLILYRTTWHIHTVPGQSLKSYLSERYYWTHIQIANILARYQITRTQGVTLDSANNTGFSDRI